MSPVSSRYALSERVLLVGARTVLRRPIVDSGCPDPEDRTHIAGLEPARRHRAGRGG